MIIEQRKKDIIKNINDTIKTSVKTDVEQKVIMKEIKEVSKNSYLELERHNDFFTSLKRKKENESK